jgi:hypothetical protein
MAKKPRQKLTEKEFGSWVLIREAVNRALKVMSYEAAQRDIVARLQRGILRSGAEYFWQRPQSDKAGDVVEIEPDRWRTFTIVGSDLWESGNVTLWQEGEGGGFSSTRKSTVDYFGVRLDPVGLAKITGESLVVPQSPVEATQLVSNPAPAKNLGGRRPVWWREAVLIELAGQLHNLELEPRILADLERAAKDWLGKQGEYPGERTVRSVVTPLWQRIEKGGKNPKG